MQHEHAHLGFERPIPVKGDGVNVPTPEREQYERMREAFESASKVVETFEGDGVAGTELDASIADVVSEAAEEGNLPEAAALGVVGMGLEGDQYETAKRSVAELPGYELIDAITEAGPETVDEVAREISNAVNSSESPAEAVDAIEPRPNTVETEESPAQSLIGRLRLQRERVGTYNAEMARYRDGIEKGVSGERPEYADYNERDFMHASEMLRNPSVSASDSVKILEELYDAVSHERLAYVMNNKRHAGSGLKLGDADEGLSMRMCEYLKEVPFVKIKEMRSLPENERGRVNFILDKLSVPTGERRNYRDVDVKYRTRLAGYGSVREYYEATQTGEVAPNDLTYLDIIEDLDPAGPDSEKNKFGFEFLEGKLGLPSTLASEMLVAMYGKASKQVEPGGDRKVRKLVVGKLCRELEKVARSVEQLGIDNVLRLRENCGIINVGELSLDQAERMVKFLDRDSELLEELGNKEVCLVLADATSDWNGAYSGMYREFETNQQSTVIFEFPESQSIAERAAACSCMLEERGTEPSVIVIMGHGSPDFIHIGGVRLLPRIPDKPPEGFKAETLESSGFLDILLSMKPDTDGNCSVVLKSCSQDAPLAHEDDTTLTRTAGVLSKAGPDNVYQIYGIKEPGSIARRRWDGSLVTNSFAPIERVIVTPYGVYRHMREDTYPTVSTVPLPMFETEPPELADDVEIFI